MWGEAQKVGRSGSCFKCLQEVDDQSDCRRKIKFELGLRQKLCFCLRKCNMKFHVCLLTFVLLWTKFHYKELNETCMKNYSYTLSNFAYFWVNMFRLQGTTTKIYTQKARKKSCACNTGGVFPPLQTQLTQTIPTFLYVNSKPRFKDKQDRL